MLVQDISGKGLKTGPNYLILQVMPIIQLELCLLAGTRQPLRKVKLVQQLVEKINSMPTNTLQTHIGQLKTMCKKIAETG